MRKVLLFSSVFIALIFVSVISAQVKQSSSFQNSSSKNKVKKQPILVELFTAEGCYNCPPAEKLLAKLEAEQPFAGAELITLAFHVDYWDSSGWKDRFASPLFSQRQRVYDRKFLTGSIYTPQMIVDGNIEFIGSKPKLAEKAVKRSIRNKKAQISLSVHGEKLKIKITAIPKHKATSVYLAIAENDINSKIEKGLNSGKVLNQSSVVRELKGLGLILPETNSFEMETNLQFQPEWKKENLKLIVFIQENRSRKILGADQVSKLVKK